MGDIRGWAFGLLRMGREEFGLMRPGEFFEALRAYRDEKNADRRHVGELVRGAALRLFNLQIRKKDRITDPRKFWKMPWDEEIEDKETRIVRELNALSDEERFDKASSLLEKIGWR